MLYKFLTFFYWYTTNRVLSNLFEKESVASALEIPNLFECPRKSLWSCTFLEQQKPTRSDQNRQVHNFVRS